jgi:hypothetical protein
VGTYASARVFASGDGDGANELWVDAERRPDSYLRVFDGRSLSGRTLDWADLSFPGNYQIAPVLGDLDGDGATEVVLATFTADGNAQLGIYSGLALDGSEVDPGLAVTAGDFAPTTFAGTAAGDYDGDGASDLVIGLLR